MAAGTTIYPVERSHRLNGAGVTTTVYQVVRHTRTKREVVAAACPTLAEAQAVAKFYGPRS